MLYAVARSFWAVPATASASCMVPDTIPGGKPVTAVPGHTPKSPAMVVGPVLVTVEPAKTAKLDAVPRRSARALGSVSGKSNAHSSVSSVVAPLGRSMNVYPPHRGAR